REGQTAELVFAVGIGAANVEQQVGMKALEGALQVSFQDRQVVGVADAVGQMQIDIRGRLRQRIVVFLVDRERKDIRVAAENLRGTVAVMHIGVHYDRSEEHTSELQSR